MANTLKLLHRLIQPRAGERVLLHKLREMVTESTNATREKMVHRKRGALAHKRPHLVLRWENWVHVSGSHYHGT